MICPYRRYFVVLILLVVFDGIWITAMTPFYQRELASLFTSPVRPGPALLFYLLYPASIIFFAVHPATSPLDALRRGALLGGTAYGTYDLTNRATLEHFSLSVTCIDLMWGIFITGVVAGIAGKMGPRAACAPPNS